MRLRLLALMAAVFLSTAVLPTMRAEAQEQNGSTPLTVVGRAQTEARPDRAEVTYDLARAGRTREQARAAVARRTRSLLGRLRTLGIDPLAIRVSEVQVARRRERAGLDKPFAARAQVSARATRPTIAGRMLDLGPGVGADVEGPFYSLVDDTAAKETATRRAVDQARRRAEAVAAGLGLRITAIRSIALDGAQATDAQGAPLGSNNASSGGPPTPTAPGTITVEASATVVFVLSP